MLEVAEKHGVPLVGGKCQNPRADGREEVCGLALGAHPSVQGNYCRHNVAIPFEFFSLIVPSFYSLAMDPFCSGVLLQLGHLRWLLQVRTVR